MRWLVDECVDAGLVTWLRSAGHEVVYMAEVGPADTDIEVVRRAQNDGQLLFTEDKDFGDLVFRRRLHVPGLVLSRIDPAMHALKRQRLATAIDRFGDDLYGLYLIIEETRFRSRSMQR